ncbi:MAG TPA: invasin domain 3-containing protein [Anaerolineae bacterium]|nr:invasin domain 3-containing protein [Anaerolineae bacterium]
MTRWIFRGAAAALALLAVLALVSTITFAGPPLYGDSHAHGRGAGQTPSEQNLPALDDSSPGYTLEYSFSSDPKDNTYVASFTPDVKAIYAWATIVANGGVAQKQFTVDIEFLAPDGTPVDSEWYENDTGTVTTYPADQKTFGDENVARRFINVAGTPNAQQIGQWTVNYTVGGKLISSGNFSIAGATDIAQDETEASGEQLLTDAGYDVIEFTEAEGKSGNLFAYTIMTPVNKDLYSSDTTQQIVDGLAALRKSFPNSEKLYVFLRYDPRYEIAYFADAPDVDAYLQSNDFDAFANTITVDVYDNQKNQYLGKNSTAYINKNFGAGNYSTPPSPPLAKNSSTVGSIRVTVSPTNLPADGTSKAIVSVTVFDKRNKPLADAEVTFEVSGSSGGTIRPRVTSTDENGEADAVFTVSKTNGSATITATSGGASSSGSITVGAGSSDSAADNVIASLSAQGLTATKVGYLGNDKSIVGVIVDLGDSYTVNDLGAPIVYGMTALRINYPDATTLVVYVPYQTNLLRFTSSTTQYDALLQALDAAKTQDDKDAALTDFLGKVFAQSAYVDQSGKQLSTFKDFYNKNFTGG